ncbi:MAG: hypothetical protein AB7V14_04025 [Kiritimatiellia bacterium]
MIWKRIGWKLLAALFTLLWLNYWLLYDDPFSQHILEIIQGCANIIGIIGLWGLGFGIPLLNRYFWKALFAVDLVIFLSCLVFLRTPGLEEYNPAFLWALLLVPILPYYVGLFVYGFKSREIWETHK